MSKNRLLELILKDESNQALKASRKFECKIDHKTGDIIILNQVSIIDNQTNCVDNDWRMLEKPKKLEPLK